MGLLSDVRNYLDITWDDPEGDEKLSGIISRGKSYLNRIAGAKQDYSEEAKPRELLFEYCRYVRDDALDEFEANYLSEIIALQADSQVAAVTGSTPGGETPGGSSGSSKIIYVFYLPDNLVGGFSEDGYTITYTGGAVRYYCHGNPDIEGIVTIPSGSFQYAHSQFILLDLDSPSNPISTGPWPTDDRKKACGYMHDNMHIVDGLPVRVKVAELYGMGTQVWRP